MDVDDVQVTGKLPSRVTRFAPKSSKPKPKPKPPSQPKSEPQEELAAKKEDVDERVAPTTHTKSEAQDEAEQVDSMDLDLSGETVVREIDLFLAPSIDAASQLYILQYPLRPCWRPYVLDERCEEVRLKPKSSQMEIDLSVDMDSSNIDPETASKLNFTKQTLETKWNPPSANGYAVGLLKGDKLQLHPVHAVVQLRPAFHHLQSSGSNIKNHASTGVNASVKIEGSIEEKSVAAPKKQNKQRKLSHVQQIDNDEGWVALKYHSCKSDISSQYLEKMMMHESHPIKFTMNDHDYVNALCPGVNSNISSKGPFKRYLLSLPVEERLKKLLLEDPPFHQFSAIKHYAPEYSEEELLGFLQEHAILIQGHWTANSNLFSPNGDKGDELLARDFVMLLFSRSLRVQASDLNLRGNVGIFLQKWLNKFGLEGGDPHKSGGAARYWKFREIPDESFRKLHPNIAEK